MFGMGYVLWIGSEWLKELWTVSLPNDLIKINKPYLKILDRLDGGCNQGISSVREKLREVNRISSFFCFFVCFDWEINLFYYWINVRFSLCFKL